MEKIKINDTIWMIITDDNSDHRLEELTVDGVATKRLSNINREMISLKVNGTDKHYYFSRYYPDIKINDYDVLKTSVKEDVAHEDEYKMVLLSKDRDKLIKEYQAMADNHIKNIEKTIKEAMDSKERIQKNLKKLMNY